MAHLDPAEASQVFAASGWVKSSFSTHTSNNCVEWNTNGALVGLRDSKQLDGPVLVLSPSQWEAFQYAVLNRMDS